MADIGRGLEKLAMPAEAAEKLLSGLEQEQTRQSTITRQIKHRLAEIDAQTNILYSDRLAGRITAERHDRHASELGKRAPEPQKPGKLSNFRPEGAPKDPIPDDLSLPKRSQVI